MNKKDNYIKRMEYIKAHKGLRTVLTVTNLGLSGIIFAGYTLLLIYLLVQRDKTLAMAIIVPLDSLIIMSVFRFFVNRPRPYEAYDTTPALSKATKGNSFPSRHVFSVVIIAFTCFAVGPTPALGIFLLLCGVAIGVIRVIGGVHYLSDVLAGAGVAVLLGVIGFYVVPTLLGL